MKFDSGTMIQNPSEGGPVFKALEDAGFDGAYTWEGAHDPFLPLVSAATATTKIELLTSIAVAFSRNPVQIIYHRACKGGTERKSKHTVQSSAA